MATRRSFVFSSLSLAGLHWLPSFAQSTSGSEVNVLKLGAVGDGVTLDTAAIQQAIDTMSAAGGGRVLVPGGKRFLIGALMLKNNVDLHLADDAVLLASPDKAHYAIKTLAATPPMGWNSWNWFAEKVTDKDVRQAADLLISSGMRDAGYVYVNIDETWEGARDANGILHSNGKFPDMKALADYVHSKGLKLGIYSSPVPKTCARFEGSMGHEDQDAQLYASWVSTISNTTSAASITE